MKLTVRQISELKRCVLRWRLKAAPTYLQTASSLEKRGLVRRLRCATRLPGFDAPRRCRSIPTLLGEQMIGGAA